MISHLLNFLDKNASGHGLAQFNSVMTSWHGNAFSITGPLWGKPLFIGEFTWHRVSNMVLCFFIICLNKTLNKQFSCRWFEMPWRFDVFFSTVRLNKPLNKQSVCRWFETLWRVWWHHCYGTVCRHSCVPHAGDKIIYHWNGFKYHML